MRKIISIVLTFSLMLSLSVISYADSSVSPDVSGDYQEYAELKGAGTLGQDISYELWSKLKADSMALESTLENSDEFTLVYDSTDAKAPTAYRMTTGDVFVTNGTSVGGLTGHAGIAISSLYILHIQGPGYHPATIKLSSWNAKYSSNGRWTKIYRHNSAGTALKAGQWTEKTYKNSNASFVINADLSSTSKTYCSKIVWQAYHYGPSSPVSTTPVSGIVLPYSLPDLIRNVRLVKTYQN